MEPKEIRMRCIEAVAQTGVRDASRLIADATKLEEWVSAAPDKEPTPPAKGRPKKTADKA